MPALPSYNLAEVEWSTNGIKLYCTEPGVMTTLLEELKQHISHKVGVTRKAISGETDIYFIDNLKSQNQDVGRWFVMQLCRQGWEPFEARGLVAPLEGSVIFRRLVQA